MKHNALLLSTLFLFVTCPAAGFAQEAANPAAVPAAEQSLTPGTAEASSTPTLAPEALILQQVEKELKDKYKKQIYIPPSIQSLIFSADQQSLLREARGGFNTKAPTEDGGGQLGGTGLGGGQVGGGAGGGVDTSIPNADGQMSVRSLSLGGIVFINPDDWTIWLNKKLVTSAKIPTQAIDLRVYKDFIEIRWFDAKSNKIFPIRLRPNQTFNLDAQTFIPG